MKLRYWNVQTTSRGVDCVAKNWALAMMLKALPLVHFWSILVMKEQMMTSVRKTLKMLVWSAQNWSIFSDICPKNNHKIGCFLLIAFWWSLPRKFPRNQAIFLQICPWKSRKIWLFLPPPIRSPFYLSRRIKKMTCLKFLLRAVFGSLV